MEASWQNRPPLNPIFRLFRLQWRSSHHHYGSYLSGGELGLPANRRHGDGMRLQAVPHHEDGLFQVSECDPFLDDNMLWRMVKKGTIPNKTKLKAIILWILSSNYDKYFLTQESEEILKSKESDVFHIRNALDLIVL
jgi:hypothetical protein